MANPFADVLAIELPVMYHECSSAYRRRVREAYITQQGGKCHHCGELLSDPAARNVRLASIDERLFPTGFFTHPVHLHHDHHTGWTIGAVHARCNAYLFQYHGE